MYLQLHMTVDCMTENYFNKSSLERVSLHCIALYPLFHSRFLQFFFIFVHYFIRQTWNLTKVNSNTSKQIPVMGD